MNENYKEISKEIKDFSKELLDLVKQDNKIYKDYDFWKEMYDGLVKQSGKDFKLDADNFLDLASKLSNIWEERNSKVETNKTEDIERTYNVLAMKLWEMEGNK